MRREPTRAQAATPTLIKIDNAARTIVAVATGVLVLLLQIDLKVGFPSSLDAGWQEVLSWGITHGAQWGKDLVFTYGPLGFLAPGIPFDPATYWLTLLLQYGFAAVTAWLVVKILRRMSWGVVLAFLLATIAFGTRWSSSSSALLIVYPLVMLVLERASRDDAPAHLAKHVLVAALAAFAALQPLVKFSAFPLWVEWVPLGAFVLWRSRTRVLVATFVLASLLTPLIVWLACGQHLSNLPAFVTGSWQVAMYYGAAMQLAPKLPITDVIALGSTLFGLFCVAAFAWHERRSASRVAVYAMFAATLALAYRAGAIRADGGHLLILWSMCAWCAPLLIGTWQAQDAARTGMRAGVMAFVLAILALSPPLLAQQYSSHTRRQFYGGHYTLAYVSQQIGEALAPHKAYKLRLRKWAADRKALALPSIDRIVGADSVDVLMDTQSALLANDLNYRPRPVFQSYSAYSGGLARMNADFFLSSRAPRWVMLDWRAIDGRYPTSDDSLALISILQDYQPVLSERGFVLLRRRDHIDPSPIPHNRPAHELPIGFRVETPLPASPGNAWFARLNVRLSVYGKLYALLFRPPKLRIEVKLSDGSRHRYTLVPSVAQAGFMLTPALASNSQYLDWLQGGNSRNVVAVRLVQESVLNHKAFKVDGTLQLYPLQLPRQQPRTLALYADIYPGFNMMPTSVSGSIRTYEVDGKSVMFLPAPGSLTFHLPAGTYDVSATFGLMPNALTNSACMAAHPDGVGIQVAVQGESPNPAAAAYINPFKDPRHRYSANYSHLLTIAAGQTAMVLLTKGPPGSTGACDWSWIRDLHFTPVKTHKSASLVERHPVRQ